MKNFAVVLSGCGVYDGSEIHEVVCTLLAIEKHGATYQAFAPDIEQHHVINHLTGEETNEKRNVLIESARLVRGAVKNLNEYDPKSFDGIIFPGGFGAAKNLSSFAFKGAEMSVIPEVEEAIIKSVEAGKMIGAECISPAFIAGVMQAAELTVGNDPETISAVEQLGALHIEKKHNEVCIDEDFNLYTTPCYMRAKNIAEVAESAEALITAMMGGNA